ncbi:MAG: hypothetical protein R2707_13595 [Acidimicrobiales bacterium]
MKIVQVGRSLGAMLAAPVRLRRNPAHAPVDASHYVVPTLAPTREATTVEAADVPVARTPAGRWREWPPMVLRDCDEPLPEGAPDLRGVWQAYKGPMKGHIERIEQAGDRVVITAAGVIHDMFANGTIAGGVHDEGVGGAEIHVVARYDEGRLDLYLNGRRRVVTRYLDGADLVWRWGPYTSRLRRIVGP